MPPTVHCIRHAQGYHNLSPENEHKYRDPDLTELGREQCRRLRDCFPYQDDVEFILVSPIRRTIQTALIGLEPAIQKKGLKLRLVPRAQETSAKPSDTGSDLHTLRDEFGDCLDSERMDDNWNKNVGEWKMDSESIERRVVELRKYIHGLNYNQVVLVAHGGVCRSKSVP